MASGTTLEATREQLDELGYFQPLTRDGLPLVQALLKDLYLATRELKKARAEAAQEVHRPAKTTRLAPEGTSWVPRKSVQEEVEREQALRDLRKDVRNLQLMNAQSATVIRNLQDESLGKSQKILGLELRANQAKVLVKSPGLFKPRIEIGALVGPSASMKSQGRCSACQANASRLSSLGQEENRAKIDIIRLYERKNDKLKKSSTRLEAQLASAQCLLTEAQREMEAKKRSSLPNIADMSNLKQSAYIMKLIKENERLKGILQFNEEAPEQRRSKPWADVPRHKRSCPLNVSRSCEDIREAVRASHRQVFDPHCPNPAFPELIVRPPPTLPGPPCCCFPPSPPCHSALGPVPGGKGPTCAPHSGMGCSQGPSRSTSRDPPRTMPHQAPRPPMDSLPSSILRESAKIRELESKLSLAREANKELESRLEDVNEVRLRQKDKLAHLAQEQKLLLGPGSPGGRAHQVIALIEKQRDVYKANVEQLLAKLDPDGRIGEASSEPAKRQKKQPDSASAPSLKILKEIQNDSRKILRRNEANQAYTASPYRSPLATSETSAWKRLSNLQEEILDLNEQLTDLRLAKVKSMEHHRREVQDLEQFIEEQSQHIESLRAEVKAKKAQDEVDHQADYRSELLKVNQAFGEFRQKSQLKATELVKEIENLQKDVRTLDESLSQSHSRIQEEKLVHENEVRQLEEQLKLLRVQLEESHKMEDGWKSRQTAEKAVGMDLKVENCKLKDRLFAADKIKEEQSGQIRDLSQQVQRYVNEVKRVEELLNLREKERSELLEQYKSLSIEIDSSESYSRTLEAKIESLQMEVSERMAEFEASQRRLADLEKDLVEMSFTNENYRAQVATLGTRLDVADSQVKEARSQSTWVNDDLSQVHQLAVQLNSQKVELQAQISNQANEIDSLTGEIQGLKGEIEILSREIRDEREKSRHLEDQVLGGGEPLVGSPQDPSSYRRR